MQYTEHFENFWIRYGADESMSNAAKGSKFKAQESWLKISKQWYSREHLEPDEQAFAQMVWRGYEAQKANRRALRSTKEFVPTLPHVTTWLNQWRFETELDRPTGELRRMAAQERHCDVSGCTEAPIGRSYKGGWICRTHDIRAWGDANRDQFRALLAKNPRDPGESWREWSWRTMGTFPIGEDLMRRLRRANPELDLEVRQREEAQRQAHYRRIEARLAELRAEAKAELTPNLEALETFNAHEAAE